MFVGLWVCRSVVGVCGVVGLLVGLFVGLLVCWFASRVVGLLVFRFVGVVVNLPRRPQPSVQDQACSIKASFLSVSLSLLSLVLVL